MKVYLFTLVFAVFFTPSVIADSESKIKDIIKDIRTVEDL